MTRVIRAIDQLRSWSGTAFGWLIVPLTFLIAIEIFKRLVLNAPTPWMVDVATMLSGTLFLMCGAYAVRGTARGVVTSIHVRPRAQASLGVIAYVVVFIPGVLGLISAGVNFAADAWGADAAPVYQFKTIIPIVGALVLLQGIAEILRCIVTIRTGAWPPE
jgi:TRAP-type mannitol/chloroaromatic compound transport system permease small subunit